MAEKETEDFLTCAVCYDVLKDPRNLSCGHTFCRSCLSQFTVVSAAVAGSVPCPYCRQMTKVPDNSVSREKWAGQLERSVLLTELEDMAAIVRRDKGIEKVDYNSTMDVAEGKRRYQDQSQLTSYCFDCKITIFNESGETKHRGCRIVTAEEALPFVIENLRTTNEKLRAASKATSAEAEELKSRRQVEVEKSRVEVIVDIRAKCEELIEAFRRREAMLVAEVDQKADEEIKKLQLGFRLTERSAKVQQQQADLVDEIVTNGSDIGKLQMQDTSSKLFFENENPGKYSHFQNFWVKHKIHSIDFVLQEVVQGVQVEYASPNHQQSLFADLRDRTFNVKREDDDEIPFLVDVVIICFQEMYAVVVTDNSNCCARSIHKGDNFSMIESRISFDSPPWGIDKLVSNQILVALPNSQKIARLKVIPELETITKISTVKSYRSIAVLNHMTIVAGVYNQEHACVDILDLSGQIQRSFSSEFPMKNPSYLSFFRQDSFLVSDYALGSVTCVNVDGEVQFTYRRGVRGPSGISVDKRGNIFIVDRETGKLVVYDQSKSTKRPEIQTIIDADEETPWGVCVDKYDNVYVIQGRSIRDHLDFYRERLDIIYSLP